ncbi:MAG: GIY-YIG nuclease family protein [Candidatus Staskawiczbacteria bacterium]|jgi:predicted GIY-YIG superfamily endonuclease
MYYVYCIQDLAKENFYYGYTGDLVRRLKEHKRENKNWDLIYYEAYRSEADARKREQKLKDYGQSRTHLKKRIINSIIK